MSTTINTTERKLQARRIVLNGRVQGAGLRPTIYRLATRIGLTGTVRNSTRGVEIDVEGTSAKLDQFSDELLVEISHTVSTELNIHVENAHTQGYSEFSIEKSTGHAHLSTPVPEDRAVCPDCLRDCQDHNDRRHGYPLTSCTRCGPRYTVIHRMPYERADTSMAGFEFCQRCRAEYESPDDRRFHAQTTACPQCGPNVWCADENGRVIARTDEAIQAVIRCLLDGKIVAIRGIGGYQLLVDATNIDAVRRLRERKRRTKPLAVLVDTLQVAESLAHFSDAERQAFTDASNPIVLLRAKLPSVIASEEIHPGLDTIGLMLPTSPLHALIARGVNQPLVCTSGNLEGEPLEYKIDEAQHKLAGIFDVCLHHDRPIVRPIDDSVVRVIAGRRVTIRLARGLAPLSLNLPCRVPTIALGGFQKSAAAWTNGSQAVLGPHVGDHGTLSTRERFLDQLDDWQQLYQFQPRRLVHDLHPDYFTTSWAKEQKIDTQAVQHHHGHIVAGMLEHGWLDREVLGVAWDGTGFGTDKTIWGGEFLLATAGSFRRVASLRPFRLPGGKAAIRQPWRIAVGQVFNLPESGHYLDTLSTSGLNVKQIQQIASSPNWSTATTSAGRLFDAAAAIILDVTHAEFEGQPAMMLEAAANRWATGQYPISLRRGKICELDWEPMFVELLADRVAQLDPASMAMKFHRTLAGAIVHVCQKFPGLPVVLGGGVFQNRLLTELVVEMFGNDSRTLGLPGIIPPNDGGLAAGQLAIAVTSQE